MQTFKIYQDKAGKWRWTRTGGNNKVMADSGQGYANMRNCRRAIQTALVGLADEVRIVRPGRMPYLATAHVKTRHTCRVTV